MFAHNFSPSHGVCNPTDSSACPKPAQIGRIVAGRALAKNWRDTGGGGTGYPNELASTWVVSADASISPPCSNQIQNMVGLNCNSLK